MSSNQGEGMFLPRISSTFKKTISPMGILCPSSSINIRSAGSTRFNFPVIVVYETPLL